MPRTSKACWATRAAALLLAALLAACGGEGPPPLHLEQASFRLEAGAPWEPPSSPPFAPDETAGWTTVDLPHARGRSVAETNASLQAAPDVAWYRVDLPTAGSEELYLYLPRWQTIGIVAVYADGRLVYRTRGSRVWNSFNSPLWIALTDPGTGLAPRSVMVRMASQHGVGGAVSTLWIGDEGNLLWRYRVRAFIQNDFVSHTSAAFLIIGLFSFAVWCVRRREPMYALFFVSSITHVLRSLHYVMGEQPPLLPDDWFGWMTVNSLGWSMVAVFSFAFRVHRKRMPAVAVAVVGLVLLCTLATLPVPLLLPHLNAIMPLVYIAIVTLTAVVTLSGLWASYKARSREGLVLFGWFSLNVPVGVHDLMMVGYRIDMEHVYLAPYTSFGLFTIFMVIVWRRYVGAIREVETVNAGLETRLAARERDLTASHEQLRELERQRTLTAERQRLMQDMHDGIGSSLISALRMVERGQASTADTAQVLKDCIDDLKLAIDSLDTTDADLLALLAAVRFRLAPRLKAAGIELTWSVKDLPPLPWLDPQSALHVLRILQEVLTNILKHSRATFIDVSTSHQGGEAVVSISDNGDAFIPPAAPATTAGKGLANVRNRTLALGARCEWSAWEGGGEFRLWLPLRRGAGLARS